MKFSELVKCCLNYKALIGIAGVIVLLVVFVPQLAAHAWVPLIALICPISMIVMMLSMRGHNMSARQRVFVCPECGLSYERSEWAKKCAAWCREHQSCNLAITDHAIENNHA